MQASVLLAMPGIFLAYITQFPIPSTYYKFIRGCLIGDPESDRIVYHIVHLCTWAGVI